MDIKYKIGNIDKNDPIVHSIRHMLKVVNDFQNNLNESNIEQQQDDSTNSNLDGSNVFLNWKKQLDLHLDECDEQIIIFSVYKQLESLRFTKEEQMYPFLDIVYLIFVMSDVTLGRRTEIEYTEKINTINSVMQKGILIKNDDLNKITYDLHARTSQYSGDQYNKLSEYMQKMLESFVWEGDHFEQLPDKKSYLLHRAHTIGAYPYFELAKYHIGFKPNDPLLQKYIFSMEKNICMTIAISNDLFSYKRDVINNELGLVRILNETGDKMYLYDACEYSIDIVNTLLREYVDIKAKALNKFCHVDDVKLFLSYLEFLEKNVHQNMESKKMDRYTKTT